MNVEFCMNCGGRYEYSLKKPNFCSSCGLSFAEGATHPVVVEVEGAEEEVISPKPITKLEYEIERSSKSITWGELVGQASQDPNDAYIKQEPRPLPKGGKQGDIQKQLLDECRSAREPDNVSG